MPTADVAVAASNRVEAAIELTRALIRVPTVDPAGCAAAADIVETELRAHGLVTERHDVMGPEGGPYPTVLAWLGERTLAPGLILSAHLDTSPPAPESTRDAYAAERSGGRIWGRGSTFAKSDVAVYLNAAVAARDLGIGASALVSITADEGQGGAAGPGHLLGALGISPARAITPGITRAVGYATNGAVQLHVTVTGRAAHQSLIDPDEEAMRHAVALGAAVAAEYDRLSELDCTVPGIAHPTIMCVYPRRGTSKRTKQVTRPRTTSAVVSRHADALPTWLPPQRSRTRTSLSANVDPRPSRRRCAPGRLWRGWRRVQVRAQNQPRRELALRPRKRPAPPRPVASSALGHETMARRLGLNNIGGGGAAGCRRSDRRG